MMQSSRPLGGAAPDSRVPLATRCTSSTSVMLSAAAPSTRHCCCTRHLQCTGGGTTTGTMGGARCPPSLQSVSQSSTRQRTTLLRRTSWDGCSVRRRSAPGCTEGPAPTVWKGASSPCQTGRRPRRCSTRSAVAAAHNWHRHRRMGDERIGQPGVRWGGSHEAWRGGLESGHAVPRTRRRPRAGGARAAPESPGRVTAALSQSRTAGACHRPGRTPPGPGCRGTLRHTGGRGGRGGQ